MISCPASATWSHLVLSLCCTKHGSSRGAIRSERISTVAMLRSGQLDMRCTIEPNCSGLSTRPADASVTRDRALDTCKPSCVPGATSPFFIPMVHSLLGVVGYVAAPNLSSQ
jgi:hypothetical protein